MIEFWVTRASTHPKYPGGLWRFWGETWDSLPTAERLLGPKPGTPIAPENENIYRPDGSTLLESRRDVEADGHWVVITDEAEALRILLGGEQ